MYHTEQEASRVTDTTPSAHAGRNLCCPFPGLARPAISVSDTLLIDSNLLLFLKLVISGLIALVWLICFVECEKAEKMQLVIDMFMGYCNYLRTRLLVCNPWILFPLLII